MVVQGFLVPHSGAGGVVVIVVVVATVVVVVRKGQLLVNARVHSRGFTITQRAASGCAAGGK